MSSIRFAIVPALLAVLTSPAASKGVLTPADDDAVLYKACREYANQAAGKPADPVQAQACHSFVAGYIMGWQNRQNTPAEVVGGKTCLTSKDTARVVASYLKSESGGPMPMPPSTALMGELALKFPCRK